MGWLGIALVLVLGADMLLKSQSWVACFFAMVIGALAAIPVKYAYQTLKFNEVAIIWASLVLISSLLVAHFYYHETLSWSKLVASVLALGAIYLTGK